MFLQRVLFLDRGDMPTEDEQFEAHRPVVDNGRSPVTIRMFDLGYDKDPHPGKVYGRTNAEQPAVNTRQPPRR
ncbi:MAG: hypothetical protein IPJ27_19620 [Candidatus Accumulibacter sp.]|uniref:Uncharacterized protein n=1 Tax=Candidatus Accumulibacter proximus TaxID=2954385 RepID=A0A935Q0J9_9PROT|nr:hypothetical protein [Candidatus Accumulibacter proximus]